MAALMLVATVAQAAGTIMSGAAANQAGQAQQGMMEYRAKQEEQGAGEARAMAQRKQMEEEKSGRLALSALQARSAASGGGATDDTIIALGEGIAGKSMENALMRKYDGDFRAQNLMMQADSDRMAGAAAAAEGHAKQMASYFSAAGTIAGGAAATWRAANGASLPATPRQIDSSTWGL